MAFRVPVADVSVVDLVVRTRDKAPMAAVVDSLRKAEAGRMRGILKVTDQMVVSSDFVGEKASAVFDVNASMALNDHMLKLVAWYDNEMGYAQRCVELAAFVMVRQAQAGKEE
jgi:glyceraldehyde 3-phosphate dehydrogenase